MGLERTDRRCGTCRLFWPCGETNEGGRRLGYCPEFPAAGKLDEDCSCQGEETPYKPISIDNWRKRRSI